MSKLIMMLLMIFWAGCKTIVCRDVRRYQIPTVKLCDISIKFERCRCRLFNANNWTALSEAEDGPLSDCEGLAGFNQSDIALSVRPNVKALDRIKRNLCGEDKEAGREVSELIEFGKHKRQRL